MKKIKTFNQLFENQSVGRFKILPNGNLEISLDGSEDRVEMETYLKSGSDEDFLWDFFESELTNGYNLVGDEFKGLTEAPMISDGLINDETTEEEIKDTKVWYYDKYMTHSLAEELLKNGKIVFTKHYTNESNVNEKEVVPATLTAPEVEAIEGILEGLAGVLSEGRLNTDNYWNNLDKDLGLLMGVLKRSNPTGYKKLKNYF